MEQESSGERPLNGAADSNSEASSDRGASKQNGIRSGAKARASGATTGLRALSGAAYAVMTEEERYLLTTALGRCIEGLLRNGRAVFLDGLGVVFPETSAAVKSYVVGPNLAVRRERSVAVNFEKCVEIVAPHRERFRSIVESRELAAQVFLALPLAVQLRWPIEELKRCIQGLCKAIRVEVVSAGVCKKLDKVGVFYALHNRHGVTPDDWFAGADIFISSPLRWIDEVAEAKVFERPELAAADEVFAAAFGAPVGSFDVDVVKELGKITGLTPPSLPAELQTIKVKVFAVTRDGELRSFLFCTEGVRSLAIGRDVRHALRCELTIEAAVEESADQSVQFPLWPRRAFALAAAVIAQQLLGRDCAWLGGQVSISEHHQSALVAVLLQRSALVTNEQLSAEGEFSYVNIIGLTLDECELGESQGLSHLLALLRRKGLDRINRLGRNSVIARTTIQPSSKQPRVMAAGLSVETAGLVQ